MAAIMGSRAAQGDAPEVQHLADKSATGLGLLCGVAGSPSHAHVCLGTNVAGEYVGSGGQFPAADAGDRRAETCVSGACRHAADDAGIAVTVAENAIDILGDEDHVRAIVGK